MKKFSSSEKSFYRQEFMRTKSLRMHFLRTIFFNDENSLPSVWFAFFVENFKIELFYNDFQLWIGVSGSLRLRSDYHESIECDIELFPGNNKEERNKKEEIY